MKGQHHSPFLDVDTWPNLTRRNDDIIIATYAKFGPLRMQHIVANILARASNLEVEEIGLPWTELRHPNPAQKTLAIESLASPRILRTHLRAPDVYSGTGKYLYIGRDPRDLVWNLYRFHQSTTETWRTHFSKYGFSPEKPNLGFDKYWEHWIAADGIPYWSYFERLKTWWDLRAKDNVLFLHYLDFKTDMDSVIREICAFLNVSFSDEEWLNLLDICSYKNISKTSKRETPFHSPFWNGGLTQLMDTANLKSQLNWRTYLTDEHQARLEGDLENWIGKAGTRWTLLGRRGLE